MNMSTSYVVLSLSSFTPFSYSPPPLRLPVRRQAEYQVRINSPEALAAAAAKAAADAALEAEAPVHESNDWGISVSCGDGDGAGQGGDGTTGSSASNGDGSAAPSAGAGRDYRASSGLAEGLQFAMPEGGGIGEAQLQAEGIGQLDAGVDDLMAQLAALSK